MYYMQQRAAKRNGLTVFSGARRKLCEKTAIIITITTVIIIINLPDPFTAGKRKTQADKINNTQKRYKI